MSLLLGVVKQIENIQYQVHANLTTCIKYIIQHYKYRIGKH